MPWFVFYPVCRIEEPSFACSHAWLMYFLFGIFSTLTFQNPILAVLNYGCFLLATLYFDIGLPWYEIIWHLCLGYAVAFALLLINSDLSTLLKIPLNIFSSIAKVFRLTLVFFTFFFGFYAVDDPIAETGEPYGLALAMVFSITWVMAAGSIFFCGERMQALTEQEHSKYWTYWSQLMISTVLAFLVAFLPTLSAYYKALIAAPVVFTVLYLHARYHHSLEISKKNN